ncbi:hypothetical protein [Sphingomonas turrisvirgatae]|uniref:Uncharacterized protein n=1 Tax=Sphingomonas turrisvirgatae TaxID=1888892 RepID=A0A1E3LYN3_9SPHN|nr:hypothetical protein [Sphingomonas turrisvirgatae]ODP38868.1 hypothetical protein BFL28_13175 [Sphingomonas turrisvirgatae]
MLAGLGAAVTAAAVPVPRVDARVGKDGYASVHAAINGARLRMPDGLGGSPCRPAHGRKS